MLESESRNLKLIVRRLDSLKRTFSYEKKSWRLLMSKLKT